MGSPRKISYNLWIRGVSGSTAVPLQFTTKNLLSANAIEVEPLIGDNILPSKVELTTWIMDLNEILGYKLKPIPGFFVYNNWEGDEPEKKNSKGVIFFNVTIFIQISLEEISRYKRIIVREDAVIYTRSKHVYPKVPRWANSYGKLETAGINNFCKWKLLVAH